MTQKSDLISAEKLTRYFYRGDHTIKAVDNVDFSIYKGEFVCLVGSSGSGKSTVLNLLAGLDRPTGGSISVESRRLDSLTKRELAQYRANMVGMVFQSFNLIQYKTALENVALALYFDGCPRTQRKEKAIAALTQLGLEDRLDHRPSDLSGGEQQRVAIARALVKEPDILFADEPTGNLDQENSEQIAKLLIDLKSKGLTVVMVTHDLDLANRCADRIIKMHYGKIVEISRPGRN